MLRWQRRDNPYCKAPACSAKSESQPEQEGTEFALAYFALKSDVSMQKWNRKHPRRTSPKKTIPAPAIRFSPSRWADKTAHHTCRSAERDEEDGKSEHKENSIEEDRPPMPATVLLQLFRSEASQGSHKSGHQWQHAGGQERNHPGQKCSCMVSRSSRARGSRNTCSKP